ncbi:MAG: phosphoadenosine phosphosulfate reductase [Ktedonobacteraceae bacterium]|nr:phosphoadenosine phosphosulfate reductase [Ktedonobacteraceae bacterium]
METFGPDLTIAHYQLVEEEWPGTLEYGQQVCAYLGVPLYVSQGKYYGYRCLDCGRTYLSAHPQKAMCRLPKGCGSHNKQFLRMVESVHDIIEWREKWVSKQVRACTRYFKTEVFNSWARNNKLLLGNSPLLVLGERWLESEERTKIPELRYRRGLQSGWMMEWHPILGYRRIDSFRKLRENGIEPHYCYRVQWRELLREEHEIWRLQDAVPHCSYEGQWNGLREVEYLSDAILNPMIDEILFEVDEEGGPRCSCVSCFFKPAKQLRASYRTEEGRPVIVEAMHIEEHIGFTMKQGHTIRDMVEGT